MRISQRPPTDVARTLVSAASRLVSTLFRACDTLSKDGADMSIGAVCKRASIMSARPNIGEICERIYQVDSLPTLGSGKPDLCGVKARAQELPDSVQNLRLQPTRIRYLARSPPPVAPFWMSAKLRSKF